MGLKYFVALDLASLFSALPPVIRCAIFEKTVGIGHQNSPEYMCVGVWGAGEEFTAPKLGGAYDPSGNVAARRNISRVQQRFGGQERPV